MVGNLYYKKYVEKLISSNPTDITIKRMEKVDNGYGGWTDKETTVNEQVAFYDRKARREVISDYGTSYIGVSVTKILAKGDANIIKGDTFIVDGVEYRVSFVKDYLGICKQIELDVIK